MRTLILHRNQLASYFSLLVTKHIVYNGTKGMFKNRKELGV